MMQPTGAEVLKTCKPPLSRRMKELARSACACIVLVRVRVLTTTHTANKFAWQIFTDCVMKGKGLQLQCGVQITCSKQAV